LYFAEEGSDWNYTDSHENIWDENIWTSLIDSSFQNASMLPLGSSDGLENLAETAIANSNENSLALVQNSVEAWATNTLGNFTPSSLGMEAEDTLVHSSQAEKVDEICYGTVRILNPSASDIYWLVDKQQFVG
jgi:hypothetical protein